MTRMIRISPRPAGLIAALLIGTLAMGGCARQISPDVHTGRTAGTVIATETGVIENSRLVEIRENDTLEQNKTGQLLGGVAGAVAGLRFGDGAGRALASLGGAIIGSFIGAAIEGEVKRQPAIEYVVRTEQGTLVTIVQGIQPRLLDGQRVYIQDQGYGRGRLVAVN